MIAIATGFDALDSKIVEVFNQNGITDLQVVNYREFLLQQTYDTVIISKALTGQVEFDFLTFSLRAKNVRIIFLTNENDVNELKVCLNYGVYDLIFDPIVPAQIFNVYQNPKTFADAKNVFVIVNGTDDKNKSKDIEKLMKMEEMQHVSIIQEEAKDIKKEEKTEETKEEVDSTPIKQDIKDLPKMNKEIQVDMPVMPTTNATVPSDISNNVQNGMLNNVGANVTNNDTYKNTMNNDTNNSENDVASNVVTESATNPMNNLNSTSSNLNHPQGGGYVADNYNQTPNMNINSMQSNMNQSVMQPSMNSNIAQSNMNSNMAPPSMNQSIVQPNINPMGNIPTMQQDSIPTMQKEVTLLSEADFGQKRIIKETQIQSVYQVPHDYKKTIVLLSPESTGKTTIAVNMAWYFNKKGIKTSLIDTDFKKKDIYYSFPIDTAECLSKLKNSEDIQSLGISVGKYLNVFTEHKDVEVDLDLFDIAKLITSCKRNSQVVIIDLDYSLNQDIVRTVLEAADDIIIVLDQKVTTLNRVPEELYVYRNQLEKADLIINRYYNIKYLEKERIRNFFKEIDIYSGKTFDIPINRVFAISDDAKSVLQGLAERTPSIEIRDNIIEDDIEEICNNYFMLGKK